MTSDLIAPNAGKDSSTQSVTPLDIPEHNRQVTNERTRTIDQVKRLYAVVMGFALTSCFGNIYACLRPIGPFSQAGLILFAQGTAFLSLIVLFYLGAERLLDTRYLRIDSKVPTRWGLLIDLMSAGLIAIWFVILGDTFADAKAFPDTADLSRQISLSLHYFIVNVVVLYLLDIMTIIFQIERVRQSKVGDYKSSIKHHWVWLILNIVGVILLLPPLIDVDPTGFASVLSNLLPLQIRNLFSNDGILSVYIIVWHVARFAIDYYYTFASYYPIETRK